MTIEQQQQQASKVQALLTRLRPRTTAQAMNLLIEDINRAPGETLRARRDRINRQREARMVRVPMLEDALRDDLIENDSNGLA